MFKKYSEASLPPLWFFIPYEVLMMLLSRPHGGKHAGFRGDNVQDVQWAPQVVKWSRAGLGTCAPGVRAVSLCSKDTVFAQCWQSRESRPHVFSPGKVSLGGWVDVSRVWWAHFSDPHPPLSAYSLALVAVDWALTLPRSANPALSCSRQHKSAVLLQGPWKLLQGWWLVRLYSGRQTLYE